MSEPSKVPDRVLGIGASSIVVALDEETVVKYPLRGEYNEAVRTERRIFERLGEHPCIVRYIRPYEQGLVLERLATPLRRHLMDLRAEKQVPLDADILRWALQISQGFEYIHSKAVVQSDIGCHNVLLDRDENAKINDFAGSGIDDEKVGIGSETRSTHPSLYDEKGKFVMKPTIETEIFAIGSLFYEMSTTNKPYADKDEREVMKLFGDGVFPGTASLLLDDVIQGCWNGRYETASQILAGVRDIHLVVS